MKKMRIMSEKPLNAETPADRLRTWITDNDVFFKRNQGRILQEPVDLSQWRLQVAGRVRRPLDLSFEEILGLPKVQIANTLECSGNSRSLLSRKASGNPWTIGGVGNAIWGGVWLEDILEMAHPEEDARHVSFEGLDQPLGSAGVEFIRSIPLAKALSSTLLAYEMNGTPLPLAHGYPLRALALGWTGANSIKWLARIEVLNRPYEGFFMDRVYRIHQKGEDPATGRTVTEIGVKSIILQPGPDARLQPGMIPIRGAAYAGEAGIDRVDVSLDDGHSWQPADLIGPQQPYAWRHWEYRWQADRPGAFIIMARATDRNGQQQPLQASWNVLGYGNNGIREHSLRVQIGP